MRAAVQLTLRDLGSETNAADLSAKVRQTCSDLRVSQVASMNTPIRGV
jgi:hypothetical protein